MPNLHISRVYFEAFAQILDEENSVELIRVPKEGLTLGADCVLHEYDVCLQRVTGRTRTARITRVSTYQPLGGAASVYRCTPVSLFSQPTDHEESTQ